MRPCLDRNADFKTGISADLHVFFPRVIACESRLAIAGVAGGRRSAHSIASDRKPLQELSVEPHIQLLRPAHTFDVVLVLPLKTNLEEVFTVYREVVIDGDAAS